MYETWNELFGKLRVKIQVSDALLIRSFQLLKSINSTDGLKESCIKALTAELKSFLENNEDEIFI